MITVFKYTLQPIEYQDVMLPIGSRILTYALQDNNHTIWALVDPNEPLYKCGLMMIGTGQELLLHEYVVKNFIGTVFQDRFVWHLFEVN